MQSKWLTFVYICIPIILFLSFSSFISSSPVDQNEVVKGQQHHEPPPPNIVVTSHQEDAFWRELYSTWPYRFVQNCLGYLVILAPGLLFVYLVKNGHLKEYSLSTNKFVQLFVYGREDGTVQNGSIQYSQLLPVTVTGDLGHDHDHPSKSESARQKFVRDAIHLGYCFFGLQLSFLTWGVLQEKIMTQDYEIPIGFFQNHHADSISSNLISVHQAESAPNSSSYHIKFRNSQFLVFINRVLAFLIAISVLLYRNRGHVSQYFFHSMQPPLYEYIYCSLSNILSSWCQYEALKYVSFPVQVLSKGCKVLAVMLMSQCLRGKTYKRTEWALAGAISFGIWLFLLNEQQEEAPKHVTAHEDSNGKLLSGVIILAMYLTFDSFTGNWQSVLFERYRISPLHMMASVNFYSILLTSVSLMQQADFFPAFTVLFQNGALLRDCVLLSICSAIGQLFIFNTISTFGVVVFTLIMTLRQVFAILLSIFIYAHSITGYGVLGIVIVFGVLFYQSYIKIKKSGGGGGGGSVVKVKSPKGDNKTDL